MAAEYQAILSYWFGDIEGEVTKINKGALWFQGGAEVDQYITDNFLPLVSKASTGELSYWAQEPRGALALIILLDQFSRNIYRGLSAAFRNDALALAICKRGLAQNIDQQLSPIERVFFYLPLEHSEVLDDQEECVFRFDQLRQLVSADNRAMFDGFYEYATKHFDVVKTFGRFPHRNAAHGRLSTTEELAWLHDSGQRFGQ